MTSNQQKKTDDELGYNGYNTTQKNQRGLHILSNFILPVHRDTNLQKFVP